jgi:hypothetical protein
VFEAPQVASPPVDTATESTADTAVAPQLVRQPTEQPVAAAAAPTMLPLAAAPVLQAAVAQPKLDPLAKQCSTDADCVLVTDGCGTLDAVNSHAVANWQAAMPHRANCSPAFDLVKAQQTVAAICRDTQCGQQAKTTK